MHIWLADTTSFNCCMISCDSYDNRATFRQQSDRLMLCHHFRSLGKHSRHWAHEHHRCLKESFNVILKLGTVFRYAHNYEWQQIKTLTSSWKQVSVSSSGVRKDDEKTSVSSCVAKPDRTRHYYSSSCKYNSHIHSTSNECWLTVIYNNTHEQYTQCW